MKTPTPLPRTTRSDFVAARVTDKERAALESTAARLNCNVSDVLRALIRGVMAGDSRAVVHV